MSWVNGRTLSSYRDNINNRSFYYEYNEDGIRTGKEGSGVETKYFLEDSNIIYEQRGTDIINYLYDLTGIIGLKYNGNTYNYVKNLQGDIIGILDSNYNQVVTYKYDSWGKILSIKDSQGNEITDNANIGIINPFRYRSYYYDTETGLYYLNSRYYNPIWGRFLNADGIIGANQDILGNNLYAYVSNNPIMFSDNNGFGIFDGLMRFAVGVQYEFNKIKNEVKKSTTNLFKGVGNFIGNITKSITKNMVLDVGKGVGAGAGPFNVSGEDNITKSRDSFTCSHSTTQSFGILEKEESYETSCYNNSKISETETTWSIVLPFAEVNSMGDVFIGINISLPDNVLGIPTIISGHLKIGWDFPSTKIKSMPGSKDYYNQSLY